MKLIRLTTLLVCAASIISVSCTKDSLDNPSDGVQTGKKTFDVVATSGSPVGKTALAEDGKTVNWLSGEKFKGFLTANGATEVVDNDASLNMIVDGNITFKHTFTEIEGVTEYTYNVLYPGGAADNTSAGYVRGDDPSEIVVKMPVDQIAPEGQMSGSSDILIAKPMTLTTASADNVDVHFKRMSATWKMNLKNFALGAGLKITAVGVWAPVGKKISGQFGLNLTDGTADYTAGAESGYDRMVKANFYNHLESGADFTVVLNTLPVSIASGETIQIDVYTSDGAVTSETITVPAGRTMNFEAGKALNFSVDMKEDLAYNKTVIGSCGCAIVGEPQNITKYTKEFLWQVKDIENEPEHEHFAVIDLEEASSFDYIELAMDAGAYAQHVTILGSDDGEAFTQIADVAGWIGESVPNPDAAGNMVVMPINFSQVSYRYVKLVFAEQSTVWGISIFQASVYNLGGSEGISISSYDPEDEI